MGVSIMIPGTGPGTGPVLPAPLFDPGVSGFVHRYAAERLDTGTFSLWEDLAPGQIDITPGSSSVGALTVADDTGIRYVRVDNSASGTAQIEGQAGIAATTAATIAMMVRKPATTGTDWFAFGAGVRFQRPSNGAFRMEGYGTGGQGQINAGSSFTLNAWHLLIGVINTATPAAVSDGITSTSVTTPPFTQGSTYRSLAFMSVGGGTDVSIDIAHAIVWDRVLDTTERATVRTAFKAKFTALP